MKSTILFQALVLLFLGIPGFSQNNESPVALGLPGDNFNLYAVLDVFQKSKTLEEFERRINDKEEKINNLDLNNDQRVDYVEVVSHKEGDFYSIVLRTAVNEKEYQDIAVIEVVKNSSGKTIIQIIGDKALYGKNYVVEPSGKTIQETPNPGYRGNDEIVIHHYDEVYYVDDWPIVIHIFSPSFVIYVSPWHWAYYPSYWSPWPPVYYYTYWGYHHHYYNNSFYRRVNFVRHPVYHSTYTTRRNSSATVNRSRRNGAYQTTYEGKVYQRPERSVKVIGVPRASERRTNVPSVREQRNYDQRAPRTQNRRFNSNNPKTGKRGTR